MIKYETYDRSENYYRYVVTIFHKRSGESRLFNVYARFNNENALNAALCSMNTNPNVEIHSTYMGEWSDAELGGKTRDENNHSFNQMLTIVKTIKFYEVKKVKKEVVKIVEIEEEVEY